MIELVDVSVKVPKQLNDVRVALVALLSELKSGKSVTEVVMGHLGQVSEAVNGIGELPEDFRVELQKSVALAGLLGGEVAGVLLS